jgi:carboxyl-terminal processing protease
MILAAYGGGFTSIAHAQTPAASVRLPLNDGAAVDLPALFDAVVDTIDRQFVDEALLKRLDWQGHAKTVRPSVLAAASAEDAADLINELILELKTSHTALYTPDDYLYYITLDTLNGAPSTADLIAEKFWGNTGPYFPGTGAFTRKVDGRHFVDGVLEGSPAEKAGLRFGDEIVSVEGKPYSPIAAFRGKIGTVAALQVRRARDAEPERYDVPVVPVVPSAAFSAAAKASARVIEKNGRRIGYIHLWSVNESRTFRTALGALDASYAAGPLQAAAMPGERGKPLDALIVDLRGRVGGNIGAAQVLLDMLGTAPKPYWGPYRVTTRSRIVETGAIAERVMSMNAGSQVRPFQGASAILVDHQTRSAGEIMAYGYKRSGFGMVVGTQTAGAVSGGAPFAMPGGNMLYVAGSSMEFDGKRLEGEGVAPDLRVERPLPYAAGADPVLDAAVEHLAKSP